MASCKSSCYPHGRVSVVPGRTVYDTEYVKCRVHQANSIPRIRDVSM